MKKIALAAAALSLAACAPRRPVTNADPNAPRDPEAAVRDAGPTREVYVLMLILDGGRADTVYGAVDDGELPNFKKYVFDRGVRVKDAIGVFPSVTTSGHQAFITGLLPGHSGITGLDWFDRASGRVTDYLSFDVLSIRDDLLNKDRPLHPDDLFGKPANLIDDLHDTTRATLYEPFSMGIPDRAPKNAPLFAYRFATNDYHALSRDTALGLREIYGRDPGSIPHYVMATFLGHDVCEHHHGANSKEMLEEMKYEDRQLGIVVDEMQKAGIWDKTYIVLSADHGQHATGSYVSLPKILKKAGLRPRGLYNEGVNTYSSLIAITSANIYLNKGDWRDAVTLADLRSFPAANGKTVDVIDTLTADPAIEFALVPELPDRVHILASGGRHGVVTRRSFDGVDYFSYATLGQAGDPLHYADDETVRSWVDDGHFHAGDEWAMATRGSLYPDAPLQLLQLFDGDRAGDLVVTASPGWHFKPRDYVSSHGGFGREDIRVPLVFSGPDLPHGTTIPFARTADVYPTMRRLFGMPVSTARMDGRPIDEILSWVPASARVAARNQPTEAAERYFKALASLEALIAPSDDLGAPARDPAELFSEVKHLDYDEFARQLDQELAADKTFRKEVSAMRDRMDSTVRGLDDTLRDEGHDEYNDGLFQERKEIKQDKEHSYILARTTDRLDARIARGQRLRQVLDLVRVSRDVDELKTLYVMQRGGAGAPAPN
jgi:arylsulfatase A-like enzyme